MSTQVISKSPTEQRGGKRNNYTWYTMKLRAVICYMVEETGWETYGYRLAC